MYFLLTHRQILYLLTLMYNAGRIFVENVSFVQFYNVSLFVMMLFFYLYQRFLTLCRTRTPDERFLEIAAPLPIFCRIGTFIFTKHLMLLS